MDIVVLREKLHEYIEHADEQHLSAIYVLVEGGLQPSDNDIYDQETIIMLQQRMEDHRNGISKSYTIEESFNFINQHKNNAL